MKCPACDNELRSVQVGEVTVDVCMDHCGGIWFDNFELQKFDSPHDTGAELLIRVSKNRGVPVDERRKRNCPKCQGIIMMRHFGTPQRGVEVDECPNCGGFWLDAGELASLREEYRTELERQIAVEELYRNASSKRLSELRAGDRTEAARAKRIEDLLRFVSPIRYEHRGAERPPAQP